MHLTQFYCLGHVCAKNYQSWRKFDEVLTKTILAVFLRHGVCTCNVMCCRSLILFLQLGKGRRGEMRECLSHTAGYVSCILTLRTSLVINVPN